MVAGRVRILDAPPLVCHPTDAGEAVLLDRRNALLQACQAALADNRRALLDRCRPVDGAMKVVGIGSVGTFCFITLLMSANNAPPFLQWKEARPSGLEPHAGKSACARSGQRGVGGRRLTHPPTDVFLGWTTGVRGGMGYVWRLRDANFRPLVAVMDRALLAHDAQLCGRLLARAHAKPSDRQLGTSGSLGTPDRLAEATGDFAIACADHAAHDHARPKAEVRAGQVAVELEE